MLLLTLSRRLAGSVSATAANLDSVSAPPLLVLALVLVPNIGVSRSACPARSAAAAAAPSDSDLELGWDELPCVLSGELVSVKLLNLPAGDHEVV